MIDKEKLVVIVGPTAVGKTEISVEIAANLDGEVISADSMQVYRGMDIGTAKIQKHEMISPGGKTIPHHLIDIVDPDTNFSVADFQIILMAVQTNGDRDIYIFTGAAALHDGRCPYPGDLAGKLLTRQRHAAYCNRLAYLDAAGVYFVDAGAYLQVLVVANHYDPRAFHDLAAQWQGAGGRWQQPQLGRALRPRNPHVDAYRQHGAGPQRARRRAVAGRPRSSGFGRQ